MELIVALLALGAVSVLGAILYGRRWERSRGYRDRS